MFARANRFHGYNALRAVYHKGQTVRGPQITLKYSPRPGRASRVAVVVSRKVSKSAVVRNRIRRRVYEAARQNTHWQARDLDLVFTAFHEQLADLPSAKLEQIVDDLLRKVTS